jgi:hypothetical protein
MEDILHKAEKYFYKNVWNVCPKFSSPKLLNWFRLNIQVHYKSKIHVQLIQMDMY